MKRNVMIFFSPEEKRVHLYTWQEVYVGGQNVGMCSYIIKKTFIFLLTYYCLCNFTSREHVQTIHFMKSVLKEQNQIL